MEPIHKALANRIESAVHAPFVDGVYLEPVRMFIEHYIGNREPLEYTYEKLKHLKIDRILLTLSMVIDTVLAKAAEMGVSNPLTKGRIHHAENIRIANGTQLFNSMRQRYLSRQYGIMSDTQSIQKIMEQGLKSFETEVVVMFIDIRSFTDWCSDKAPDTIMNALSVQHGMVAKLINSSGGRVNKIIGDGMLAYFMKDNLDKSPAVALDIQRAVTENRLLGIGIGLAFGKVIMGDLGEEARLDYTLIGATVNIASRMCDSAGRGEIALTRATYERLNEETRAAIAALASTRDLKVRLKPADPETAAVKFAAHELVMTVS